MWWTLCRRPPRERSSASSCAAATPLKDNAMSAWTRDGRLAIGASELEYRTVGPAPDQASTIVMLHEGLGSVGLWGEFPDKLAAATGCGVFAYSRAGYGASSPVKLPRSVDYMHIEALD